MVGKKHHYPVQQAQPAHVAASAQRLLHTLRFYEALTALTTASAGLLRGCDAATPLPHADAVSLTADAARAMERCAQLMGGAAPTTEDDEGSTGDAAYLKGMLTHVQCCLLCAAVHHHVAQGQCSCACATQALFV